MFRLRSRIRDPASCGQPVRAGRGLAGEGRAPRTSANRGSARQGCGGGGRPDLEPFVVASYAAPYEAIAANSRQGLNVVVDVGHHEAYSRPLGILAASAARLEGLPSLFVGVRCPLDVIMARRRVSDGYAAASPEKPVPAPVLRWQDEVHRHGIYDLEVDTSMLSPEECAAVIRERIVSGPPGTAFAIEDGAAADIARGPSGWVAGGYVKCPDPGCRGIVAAAWFSTDGITWTSGPVSDGRQASIGTVATDGDRWYAAGVASERDGDRFRVKALIWRSPNGREWKLVGSILLRPPEKGLGPIGELAAGPGGVILTWVDPGDPEQSTVYWSENGETWLPIDPRARRHLTALAQLPVRPHPCVALIPRD